MFVGVLGAVMALAGCTETYQPATVTLRTNTPFPSPPPLIVDPQEAEATITDAEVEPEPAEAEQAPVAVAFQPALQLRTCDNRPVMNAPKRNASGYISDYRPFIFPTEGVSLALAPIRHACLSSGFGRRTRSTHKGIDLSTRRNGIKVNEDNLSAGPAIILEAGWHRDFGNYVVLAHGRDIFTRYAHMKYLYPGIKAGEHIGFGTPLGPMGSTGRATADHLHYEILTGNYDTPSKSFGLTALDPFKIAARNAADEQGNMAVDIVGN